MNTENEEREIDKEKTQTYCLTFDEITNLYNETQKVIKKNDYGFAPVMMIKIEFDVEWEEKEYISTMCMHELTKAINAQKNEDKKINLPWVDITDEQKFDFI